MRSWQRWAATLLLGCSLALPVVALPALAFPARSEPPQPDLPQDAAQPKQPSSPQPKPPQPKPPQPKPQQPPQPSHFHLDVPGDKPIEVILGPPDGREAIIYLHGVCGDPLAFGSWAGAAAKHATLISLRGDEKCRKRRGRFKWTYNHARQHRRIDKALDAVDEFRAAARDSTIPVPLRRDRITLIGYSQGASRVQWLTARYPQRYPRVAIIAIAKEPSVPHLLKTERVLLMAGAKDARQHIVDGYHKLRKAKRPAHYLELPGARHGEYGPQAREVMEKGLDWLFKKVP